MLNKLTTLGEMYNRYMVKRGRLEAHRILMAMSDDTLEDIGISKAALTSGVDYWPWDEATLIRKHREAQIAKMTAAEAQAVRELNGFNDKELRDIGINRSMINDAVKYGREGLEDASPDAMNDDRQAA